MSKFFYSKQSNNKDLREEASLLWYSAIVIVLVLVNSKLSTVYFIPQVEQI